MFQPQLTTVAQPVQAIGEQAANLLLDRLAGNRDAPPRKLVLKGRLMIRNSCAGRSEQSRRPQCLEPDDFRSKST